MTTNLAAIKDLLLPGLYEVGGMYQNYPTVWPKLFQKKTSKLAVESKLQMRYVGYPTLKGEGSQTVFDNSSGQRYKYNAEHVEVGLGYGITRKAIDDNLYKQEFQPTNLGLVRAFQQFKEIQGANIFNNSTTLISGIGGDGQPLLSTAHPIDGTIVANTFSVQMDLNEASLLQSMINVASTFKDEAGLLSNAQGEQVAIPQQLEPVAIRLTKTETRPGTSNNDVNAILSTTGGLRKGYIVNRYFTSSYSWFLLTDQPGLIHFERIPFETDMQVDFTTDNLLVKGYERYSFSYNDWRAVYGATPTS